MQREYLAAFKSLFFLKLLTQWHKKNILAIFYACDFTQNGCIAVYSVKYQWRSNCGKHCVTYYEVNKNRFKIVYYNMAYWSFVYLSQHVKYLRVLGWLLKVLKLNLCVCIDSCDTVYLVM